MKWLELLIIFNTIFNLIVLYGLLRQDVLSRFEFKVRRTFWQKKPYGFSLLLWDRPRKQAPNSGRIFVGFNWLNPDWLNDSLEEKRKTDAKCRATTQN